MLNKIEPVSTAMLFAIETGSILWFDIWKHHLNYGTMFFLSPCMDASIYQIEQ